MNILAARLYHVRILAVYGIDEEYIRGRYTCLDYLSKFLLDQTFVFFLVLQM